MKACVEQSTVTAAGVRCDRTVTFDLRASRLPGFARL
jgi:hypothetical protein